MENKKELEDEEKRLIDRAKKRQEELERKYGKNYGEIEKDVRRIDTKE